MEMGAKLIVDPPKLGISMVVSIVLLIGGVMALSQERPTLVIDKAFVPVASERAVPTQATDEFATTSVSSGRKTEETAQKTNAKDDTMDVEVMTAELASFDPVTGGDWSLDNLSDFNLEISQ